MTGHFKLVVFDWDGTLADTEAQIVQAMHAAVADVGLTARSDGEISNVIGLGLREALAALLPEADEPLRAAVTDRYRFHYLAGDQQGVQLFPGVRAVLDGLAAQGYFLAVATGKGRRGLDRALAQTGLESLFHATRCADETRSKPHPQMLMELMDVVGAFPGETLMVGDTEYDLLMAGNANARSVAVSYGVHEKERLLRCNPLGCVDNLGELSRWLA